ncbi:MAG: glucose 1-dehydrogenase [Candidatus Latescibacteria bacterium]|nr:glucose 1-dehydrogenase [Candidatus Latescibacterota bacterium]
MLDLFRLDDRVAVVTGASFGLGRGMAEGLAEAGADVVAVSRQRENLRAVERAITAVGRRCLPIACDVTARSQVHAMVDQAYDHFGQVDILVNNAGIIRRAPSVEYSEEDWRAVLDLNLDGVWYCCQEVGRRMVERKRGKITNIASVISFSGGVFIPAYAASKGAVAQLTRALANEWAPHGVHVNAIAPGYCVTANTEALRNDPDRSQALMARIPAGRWGLPDDLKGAVVFLASDASDYVHGHLLVVDGGWMAR